MSRVKRYEELPESPVAIDLRPPARTGLWRTMMPVMDESLCAKCGICWMYCPDRAVEKNEGNDYTVNYDYCKGCGICAEECPRGAIRMVEEGH